MEVVADASRHLVPGEESVEACGSSALTGHLARNMGSCTSDVTTYLALLGAVGDSHSIGT